MVLTSTTTTLNLSRLDPFETYTIETSTDLISWSALTTIRTADITPATTSQWIESLTGVRRFYRLNWTPLRDSPTPHRPQDKLPSASATHLGLGR